tara:strand:- start:256 stop:603 length:348 start_codon:yes stop_codon:yes gene_type:complete
MKKNEALLYTKFLTNSKTKSSKEKLLFLAVILQALLDASKPKANNESESSLDARERATAWFFCSVGVTCDNFEYICDNASIDSSYVRTFAYKVLKSKEIKFARKRINKLLDSNKN